MNAYQTSSFAYQGVGQFAYQDITGTPPTPLVTVLGGLHKQAGPVHGPFALYNYWRSRLGEEEEKVSRAVSEAAKAEIEVAESVNSDRDIAQALETRKRSEEAYLASYKAALLEQYMEEAIIARFREEVALLRLEMKRRAALLLLLANS